MNGELQRNQDKPNLMIINPATPMLALLKRLLACGNFLTYAVRRLLKNLFQGLSPNFTFNINPLNASVDLL